MLHENPDTAHPVRPPLHLARDLAKGESSSTTRRPNDHQTTMRSGSHAPDASDNIADYYR